ncbi:hypothetical protein DC522_20405 [Microvirga sp. KLBC 81]|nr:hypothetical protein DC522_20405 [Microvirga sp. KLBC 81]
MSIFAEFCDRKTLKTAFGSVSGQAFGATEANRIVQQRGRGENALSPTQTHLPRQEEHYFMVQMETGSQGERDEF